MRFRRQYATGLLLAMLGGAVLAGCSQLLDPTPRPSPEGTVDPERIDLTQEDRDFPIVDHYVGVEELAQAAITTACREPERGWTQQEAEDRWTMAILFDASEYPSRLLAVKYTVEDARHYERFLIDVVRPRESYEAAELYCSGERERWAAETARQRDACSAAGTPSCWSRDLAGGDPPGPTAALDLSEYFLVPVVVDDDYVGVHELAEATIAATCSQPQTVWTQEESDAYRELAGLYAASEFPSALSEQQNYLGLADTHDAFLVGVVRPPESFPAAERACTFAETRWAAEIERQTAACTAASPNVPACWSRDLLEP